MYHEAEEYSEYDVYHMIARLVVMTLMTRCSKISHERGLYLERILGANTSPAILRDAKQTEWK